MGVHFVTYYSHFSTDYICRMRFCGSGFRLIPLMFRLRLAGRVLAMPNGRLLCPMFMFY